MKPEMTMFLIETALRANRVRTQRSSAYYDLGIINPMNQWPKYQRPLGMMDRPAFEGHKTYPHLSRPGAGGAAATLLLRKAVLYPLGAVGLVALGYDILKALPASSSDSYRYEERMAIADRLFNNPHYD